MYRMSPCMCCKSVWVCHKHNRLGRYILHLLLLKSSMTNLFVEWVSVPPPQCHISAYKRAAWSYTKNVSFWCHTRCTCYLSHSFIIPFRQSKQNIIISILSVFWESILARHSWWTIQCFGCCVSNKTSIHGVEGGEGLYLPNCQTNLVISLYTLSLLFRKFINTTAYHLGRYEPSPRSTKELHGLSIIMLY